MKDFVRRIQKRTLDPGGRRAHPLRRHARLLLLGLVFWLVYVGFVSEHSLSRLWRLGREEARVGRELEAARAEVARLESRWKDPERARFESEQALRRQGWAKPGELIYRIQDGVADSSRR